MAQASAFDRHFSPAEQHKLAAWLDKNPAMSVDSFRDLLAERGLAVGRSTAHREKEKLEKLGERMRRSRHIRQALVERISDQDDSEQMRALIEMVSTLGFEWAEAALDAEEGKFDSKQLMELARMADLLSSASRRNQQFADAIRRQAREEVAERAGAVAREGGNAQDIIAALRAMMEGDG